MTVTESRTTPPGRRGAPRARVGLRDDRWPDWLATLCLAVAAVSLVAAAVPDWREYFARTDDLISAVLLPVVPNVVYVAVLTSLGVGLRRRLRPAWWAFLLLFVVLPGIGRLGFAVSGPNRLANIVGLVVTIVLLVATVASRPYVAARPSRAAGWKAFGVFVVGTALFLVVGWWLLSRFATGGNEATLSSGLVGTLFRDLGLSSAATFPAPLWVRAVINVLGATVVLGSFAVLLRTPARNRRLTAADEATVRGMLRDHGDLDSLGYFATRRDKAVVFDAEDPAAARAAVSYRVVSGVSLASGNPLGDPRHWPGAIGAWRREARANGWSLAVMAPNGEGARAYTAAGLAAYEIGDEAILDLSDFSLNRPGLKPVRQAVSRLRRRGYDVEVRRHRDLDADDFERLAAAASHWRGDGGDERGFSMALGRLGDPLDGDCVLVEAVDDAGALRGFISLVPWGRGGLSLDLMRRDPTADNGLVELLVTSLAEQAPRLQVNRVSLNFAMFREAFARGEELGAGPLSRLTRQLLVLASRTWQLESLYRSNAKYLPEWQHRYICFEYASDLPRVGLATGSAEGFLTRPSVRGLLRRGESAESLSRAEEDYAVRVREAMPPEPDHLAVALAATRHSDQERVRRAKLEDYRSAGVDPYPVGHPRTHALCEVAAAWGGLPADARTGSEVSVVGRVLRKRDHGGLTFLTVRDGSGDLQLMASRERLGEEAHRRFRALDLGDHVGVTGEVVTTRTGQLTVDATSFALTSKSLRPLPDKRLGLTDPEARVRYRYVDLIVRPAARDVAYLRSTVVRSIRDSLHSRGYAEVETPILQLVHGGANARPFETHINAYDLDLSLRIATELHLKRLVVGGMEKVFELGRQFRNEGADSSHNPEFTSLEVYGTYQDYVDMRHLTQAIIQEAAVAVFGEPVARRLRPDGSVDEVDLSGDWPAVPICTAVSTALGEEVTPGTPHDVLLGHARRIGLDLDPGLAWGAVLEEVYGELCESRTTTPVFYTDFPRDTSPLTRVHREDPRLVEKWDLVMWASEQGTAYSELIDPVDQRTRLVEQSLLAAAGDLEAMEVDEDFLRALEYGMPPTGGMGLGVDRLVMNLTGLGIRDTILFPLVKPT
jgi:lysyl-tRNA synthetase class 2